MTFAQKYIQEHPDDDVMKIIDDYCPDNFGYERKRTNEECIENCAKCWNREIPTEAPTQPQILDSGNRREFETGAVRDMQEGKGRFDLLPWAAIMEVAKHCENGSKKYGEHNVDRGMKTSSFLDSGCRHIAKYLDGWTDEPHLIAAAWNLLWAIQMEVKKPQMVDTPWREDEQ